MPTTLLPRNATSHPDPRRHGCSSAQAMQHSGAADVTVASIVSHDLLNSKHKSSSLAGIARIVAFGHKQPRSRTGRTCTR